MITVHTLSWITRLMTLATRVGSAGLSTARRRHLTRGIGRGAECGSQQIDRELGARFRRRVDRSRSDRRRHGNRPQYVAV